MSDMIRSYNLLHRAVSCFSQFVYVCVKFRLVMFVFMIKLVHQLSFVDYFT